MPVARFEMPDGRIARFEVPEGTTPEQAQAMIQEALPNLGASKGPLTRTEKITTGMADPIHGGAQLLTKILPEGVVRAGIICACSSELAVLERGHFEYSVYYEKSGKY